MIVEHLVYGCARLTGGASGTSARRLVEMCLDAGIRHVDSAPSYGMGTAEAVLGRALAGHPDVRVTAKVGSTRPRFGPALTYARALKGLVRPRTTTLRTDVDASAGVWRAAADPSPAAMARSIDRSRQALRRDRFDLLLLHDIAANATRVALLERLRAQGVAVAVGWSTGAGAEAVAGAHVPGNWTIQAAVSPATLRHGPSTAPAYLHGIATAAARCLHVDTALSSWLSAAAMLVPAAVADRQTALIAVAFARLHALLPDRRLIFASIDPGRLSAFLGAVAHLDRHVGVDRFARAVPT